MGGEGTLCNLTPRDRASVLPMSTVVEKAFFLFNKYLMFLHTRIPHLMTPGLQKAL